MNSHILILADGRSPTAQSWIRALQTLDYQVSLISTFPCRSLPGLHQFHVLPIAFSRWSAPSSSAGTDPQPNRTSSWIKPLLRHFSPLLQRLRYMLGPLTLRRYAPIYQDLVEQIHPDLVHALRIPFEGMLGAYTPKGIPFLAATWGNDLTLHAKASRGMQRATRRCLERADGLTSDTQRDVRLAKDGGLSPSAPTLVIPGSGGVDTTAIQQAPTFDPHQAGLPDTGAWVVNPRGIRPGSVHQEAFFAAIPRVLAQVPEAVFICPSLAGVPQAEAWVEKLGISSQTHLLPKLRQPDLWGLFQRCQLFVSPSSHDGTPNTLLEALACGCFPIAGEIESLQEWIDSGVNGLLVDPQDPEALAEAIVKALRSPDLRAQAALHNQTLIQQKAAQTATHPQIKAFYDHFLG